MTGSHYTTLCRSRREGNARAAQGTASGRESYTIQTCDPSVSRTAVRWGPQFSSSAPPRSPAPSFDHFPFGPAIFRGEFRAERGVGWGWIFPWVDQGGTNGWSSRIYCVIGCLREQW